MERPMVIDERHEAADELIALVIGEPTQRDVATQMLIAICVTTGATQRTFFGDFDRQVGAMPSENSTPGLYDFMDSNTGSAHVWRLLWSILSETWS